MHHPDSLKAVGVLFLYYEVTSYFIKVTIYNKGLD